MAAELARGDEDLRANAAWRDRLEAEQERRAAARGDVDDEDDQEALDLGAAALRVLDGGVESGGQRADQVVSTPPA